MANSYPPSLHCLKPHLLPVTLDHATQLFLFLDKHIQTMQSSPCLRHLFEYEYIQASIFSYRTAFTWSSVPRYKKLAFII